MKKQKEKGKLTIEKFAIWELNDSSRIIGGVVGDGDTNGETKDPDKGVDQPASGRFCFPEGD